MYGEEAKELALALVGIARHRAFESYSTLRHRSPCPALVLVPSKDRYKDTTAHEWGDLTLMLEQSFRAGIEIEIEFETW